MDDVRARKLALLAEFEREIAPQKLQLEALLPNIWKCCYPESQLPSPASGGKPGMKRVPAGGSGPDPKRRRTEEMEKRMEPMFKECSKIMKKLFNLQASNWFRRPVDPVKDGCPNYLHFVKSPRDLGSIKTRLQTRSYKSPMEFKTDVDLVWSNCALYNQEGTPARMDGDKCKAVFERSWRDSGIEAQLQQIQEEVDCVEAPLYERVGALNNQLVRAVEQLPASAPPEDGARGEMSFADKRRLSMRLASLPADLCQGVMDLVSADPCASVTADGEMEVEIDDLRTDTLWKLHRFVMNPSSKPSMQSEPASTPADQVAGGTAEKQLPGRGQNGTASAQTSGAGSDSDHGEPSPTEMKAEDAHQGGAGALVRDGSAGCHPVDESATNPEEQPPSATDRAASQKADVNANADNVEPLASLPASHVGASEAQPEAGDECCLKSSAQQQEAQQEGKQRHDEQEQRKDDEEELQEDEGQQKGTERQCDEAEAELADVTQQSDMPNMSAPAASGDM